MENTCRVQFLCHCINYTSRAINHSSFEDRKRLLTTTGLGTDETGRVRLTLFVLRRLDSVGGRIIIIIKRLTSTALIL